jgi:hypothetical protein
MSVSFYDSIAFLLGVVVVEDVGEKRHNASEGVRGPYLQWLGS